MKRDFALIALIFAIASPVPGADQPKITIFGSARATEVYRVLLDRDALLLESILDVIKQQAIQDGQVVISAGSVQDCTFHYVTTTALTPRNAYKTVKGPFEILNAAGVVANGEPHIHITLSSPDAGTIGGHLEKGCKVLYLAEITITKYSGERLTRRENANGVSLLESKK